MRRLTNGWRLRSLRELRRTRRDVIGAGAVGVVSKVISRSKVTVRRVASLETLCDTPGRHPGFS